MLMFFFHTFLFLLLTAVTQLGGVAWVLALCFKGRLPVFLSIYLLTTIAAHMLAPHTGRVPVSCFAKDSLQVQSWFYCLSNRNYVSADLAEVLQEAALQVEARYPGTQTLLLDANFPFLDGFPLLPHLSHKDGRKADLAFYYQDQNGGYLPGHLPSPIGYFAFEGGPTECPDAWPTLRWDLAFLQPFWRDYSLEPERLKLLVQTLAGNERVEKLFLEPHLQQRLGLRDAKLRFQGCRAARHDDHLHLQVFPK